MTKSEAMWIGYWAMRCDVEAYLQFWLRSLARGTPDTYWEERIVERAEAAMVFHAEYKRLNHAPKRHKNSHDTGPTRRN